MLLPSSSSPSYGSKGDSFRKTVDGLMRSTLTFDNNNSVLPGQNIDYGQPMSCISYPYNDSGSGVWASYKSRSVFHPQIVGGGTSTRVPLPSLEIADDEPIYVNPKQYHGILRRRQLRAKLEAQNKLVKTRKPYLHESRHRHAMKRARGSGGRFLNTKQLEQQQQSHTTSTKATTDSQNSSGSTHLRLGGGGAIGDQTSLPFKAVDSQDKIKRVAASASTFTVTSAVHNDDAFFDRHGHHLSSFSGHFGQSGAQGGVGSRHNGTQHRVSAMR
ncbi:nuclear transcription factor Y subunit A-4-like isoform X1 [Oryza brachyantha]|uniref:nuclear transcription factor Y subunit A-4-like isoform X1 n=1 Tax=Oryza brachyantha TaxID=4533 RepID=UPI0007767E97|nr:nuclear transcription factor Y subunit A-4-like isoform X1 [Oryza brachyantha]